MKWKLLRFMDGREWSGNVYYKGFFRNEKEEVNCCQTVRDKTGKADF
jgi:hypothetical protein